MVVPRHRAESSRRSVAQVGTQTRSRTGISTQRFCKDGLGRGSQWIPSKISGEGSGDCFGNSEREDTLSLGRVTWKCLGFRGFQRVGNYSSGSNPSGSARIVSNYLTLDNHIPCIRNWNKYTKIEGIFRNVPTAIRTTLSSPIFFFFFFHFDVDSYPGRHPCGRWG